MSSAADAPALARRPAEAYIEEFGSGGLIDPSELVNALEAILRDLGVEAELTRRQIARSLLEEYSLRSDAAPIGAGALQRLMRAARTRVGGLTALKEESEGLAASAATGSASASAPAPAPAAAAEEKEEQTANEGHPCLPNSAPPTKKKQRKVREAEDYIADFGTGGFVEPSDLPACLEAFLLELGMEAAGDRRRLALGLLEEYSLRSESAALGAGALHRLMGSAWTRAQPFLEAADA